MTGVAVVQKYEDQRQTLCKWIDSSPEYRCVFAGCTSKEALLEIPRRRPAVVLMDTHLPGECGIACLVRLKERIPALHIIMVTEAAEPDLIFKALRAGAAGYMLFRSGPGEILQAIDEVLSGGAPMTGEIARQVIGAFQPRPPADGGFASMSRRQNEVLELLSTGISNKEIAQHLGISYETVCVHLRQIYKKLQVSSRSAAVVKHLSSQVAVRELELT